MTATRRSRPRACSAQKYVGLGAGGSGTYLANGTQIQVTQSALVLENLVNKLFAGFAGKKEGGDAKQ